VTEDYFRLSKYLSENKLMRKPEDGEKNVKEALKEVIEDRLEGLAAVIFAAITSVLEAEKDFDETFKEIAKTAAEEAYKEVVKQRYGDFWKRSFEAAKKFWKGDYIGFCKELAEAVKDFFQGVVTSLQKGHFAHELALKIARDLRKKGITLKNEKQVILRAATKISEAVAKAFEKVALILGSAWFAAAKVFLTPAETVSDSGEIYLYMTDLGDQLQTKHDQVDPPLQLSKTHRDYQDELSPAPAVQPGPALPPLR
jgi:hypothetical protein